MQGPWRRSWKRSPAESTPWACSCRQWMTSTSFEDAALEGPMALTLPGYRTLAPKVWLQSLWIDKVFARIRPGPRRPNLPGGSLRPVGRRWPAVQRLEVAHHPGGSHHMLLHGRSPPREAPRCLRASRQWGRRPHNLGTCPSATMGRRRTWRTWPRGVPGEKNLNSELQ